MNRAETDPGVYADGSAAGKRRIAHPDDVQRKSIAGRKAAPQQGP
ncbi:MAG TPA: hypothetical protein PKX93_09200 [bacterium]|nr:hypothetical protein [bacterium]